MRICDKCKKELSKGDGRSHIELSYSFTYDLCQQCEQKFLLYVDSFFNTKSDNGVQIHRTDERRNKPVTQLRARREPATRKGRTIRA